MPDTIVGSGPVELPEQGPEKAGAIPFGPVPNTPTLSGPKHGERLFSVIYTLITALNGLNDCLQTLSTTVLQNDLNKDEQYASALSKIHFKTVTGKTSQKHIDSAYNNNQTNYSATLQAKLKAHQSQEQIDIQSATATSTNSQQMTGIISSIFQTGSQILGSVLSTSK